MIPQIKWWYTIVTEEYIIFSQAKRFIVMLCKKKKNKVAKLLEIAV